MAASGGADDVSVKLVRIVAISAAALTAWLVAGCGYDDGDDLPAVVEAATPANASRVGACGGSSGLIDFPSYGCTYVVAGDAGDVAAVVAAGLAEQGFAVSCRMGAEETIEVDGLRDDVSARAEVTDEGSIVVSDHGEVVNVYGKGGVSPGGKQIPRDAVALSLTASRQSDASVEFQRSWVRGGVACTEADLRQRTIAGCVTAWNQPENEANRKLALRRMRIAVAYVLLDQAGAGVADGCFFGFLANGGRYLMFDADWEDGELAFAEPELGYSSGKGLDADALVRPDGTLRLKPRTEDDRCEVWWSAEAGWKVRRNAMRRKLAGEVEAIYTDGPVARCVYVLSMRGEYLRAVTELRDLGWKSKPFERIAAPPRFRPNGELRRDGWLSVGP